MNKTNAALLDTDPLNRRLDRPRLRSHAVLAGAICFAAGLVAGAFASRTLSEARLLAEWPGGTLQKFLKRWSSTDGYSVGWGFTLALSLGVGIAFLAVCALRARRTHRSYPDPQRYSDESALPPDAPFADASPALDIALPPLIPLFLLGLYLVQPVPNLLQAVILFGGALVLSLLLADPGRRDPPGLEAEWPVWLLLFLVSLIAYLNTLMPAVGTRDGYELQAISATLGFAHPTGYPLFPILGRLWISVVPFGSTAWRINVLCALFAAASVPLVYGTTRRLLLQPRRRSMPFLVSGRAAAAWSALLYAFSQTLWAQASQPEKYTLNALFVALVLYIALGLDGEAPAKDPGQMAPIQPHGPHPHLRWLGFVYGLSLTHHRTMLMLAPALVLYLLWRDPGLLKRPKDWLPALGVALAPLLIYLYIPWRAYAQGWAMTLDEFLRYISGAHYGPAVRLMDWATAERGLMFWRFVVTQFGYPGIALGALGLIGLAARRRWSILVCTALAYATYYFWGTVWYAYYNDVNSFIPNHMIQAVWIGSGAMTAGRAIQYLFSKTSTLLANHKAVRNTPTIGHLRVYQAALWSLAALMPMSMLWTNGPLVDKSEEWEMTRWGENAITAELGEPLDLAPNATILADRTKHPPLDYFARIEKRRPDVDVVILGNEQAYLDRLAAALDQNATEQAPAVYLARFLPGLEGRYHLSSTGPLVRVSTTPLTKVGELEGTPATFGAPDGTVIELLGYNVSRAGSEKRDPQNKPSDVVYPPSPEGAPAAQGALHAGTPYRPGEALRVTLFWQVKTPVPGNYHVALRLVSASGQEWWSSSDHPVSGMYPTGAWKPGEIVADWHEIPIVQALPPGNYTLQVGLFPPFSQEGLPANGQKEPWMPLKTLAVIPAPVNPTPSHWLHAVAPGRLLLLGYDMPDQAPPTGRVSLRLYWQALAPPDGSAPQPLEIGTRVVLAVPPPSETDIEQGWTWTVPGKGEYPLAAWEPGTTVITEHLLTMPAEKGLATIQVAVKGDELISFYPGWLAIKTTVLSLPPMQVAGQPPVGPGATNFADQILLLDNDLEQRALPPGAPLELTVRWQGMRSMENNYTLFIHLLAPDGTLKGQIDVWPKDGTYPTSQWQAGEAFEDRYLLYIDPDAPPGAYHVEIGWYLLETMQRLPVLDAQGQALDDKVLLSGLTVQ